MEKILIFGHKNPDTDSICSALVYASLKEQLGFNVEPVRLGDINKETQFVLDYLDIEPPREINTVDSNVEHVILVDHNEFQQSVDNIREVTILEVIDHHRVANFETGNPLYFRVEPVGCTTTILNKMFKENDVPISKENAIMMISAIVSDTLLFKSPTCTDQDVAAAKELADSAGVDLDAYGLDMLKAGTDLGEKTTAELLGMDAKEFTMGQANVEVAQINAIDTNSIYERADELESEINKILAQKNLDLFLLVVTDILNSHSDALALGTATENVEKAFGVTLKDNRARLEGVVSRKKQIVPPLTASFD